MENAIVEIICALLFIFALPDALRCSKWHTDLVITRQSDRLIFGEPSADFLFSDHRAVLFHIHSSRPLFKSHEVSFRKIKSIDRDEFMNDISRSELS